MDSEMSMVTTMVARSRGTDTWSFGLAKATVRVSRLRMDRPDGQVPQPGPVARDDQVEHRPADAACCGSACAAPATGRARPAPGSAAAATAGSAPGTTASESSVTSIGEERGSRSESGPRSVDGPGGSPSLRGRMVATRAGARAGDARRSRPLCSQGDGAEGGEHGQGEAVAGEPGGHLAVGLLVADRRSRCSRTPS